MISEKEASIFEEIEKEVMRIVQMAEEVGEKASVKTSDIIKVRYLRLLRDHSKILESLGRGELIIASLEGLEDGVLKEAVREVNEEVVKKGGSVYFISKPVILVLPKNGLLIEESKS